MRTNIKILFCSLVVFTLVTSCKTPSDALESTDYTLDVNFDDSYRSDLIEGYRYVRLETNENCRLYDYNKIKVNDSYISFEAQDQLFLFNQKGEFISKLSRKGRGKGEYIGITDYEVTSNNIYILSWVQQALLKYDMNGRFIDKYDLHEYYASFKIVDNTHVFLCSSRSNSSNINFALYDLNKRSVVYSCDYFDRNEGVMFASFNDFIFSKDSVCYVTHPFDYMVYKLTPNEFSPLYNLSFNTKNQLPTNYEEIPVFDLNEQMRNKDVVKAIQLVYETSNGCYFGYKLHDEYGDTSYLTRIYNDGTQKTIRLLMSDFDKQFPYLNQPLGLYHDELVSVMSPYGIVYFETHNDIDTFTSQGYTEEDNPIVFFHKLKQ